MSKIHISVSGGCVQGVLSTVKDVKIELWDWDNIREENSTETVNILYKKWDEMVKKLHHVF